MNLQISFRFASSKRKIYKSSPLEYSIPFSLSFFFFILLPNKGKITFCTEKKGCAHNFNPIYQQVFCSRTWLYCFVALSDKVLAQTAIAQVLGKSFQHPRCGFDVWGSSVPEWSPKLRTLRSSFFLSNRLAGCLK